MALLFIFHISFSLFLIVVPDFRNGWLTTVYRKYLLPGPFFSQDRIEQSYALLISCKVDGAWLPTSQPALDNYKRLLESGNPKAMLTSRLDQYFYYQYIITRNAKPVNPINAELETLAQYYSQYFPGKTDSVKFIFMRKETTNLIVKVDTLYTITRDVVN
ncbi:MAG: hypothetical protein KF856_13635 [Cyclobacteriaceae bacterium]|nr:hypothetical protein [Cyclobacteriaceae bacterium]